MRDCSTESANVPGGDAAAAKPAWAADSAARVLDGVRKGAAVGESPRPRPTALGASEARIGGVLCL